MLVHICCSVDSHFFLQKLQQEFPNEKLIAFFYDPNIHPYSEYQLRLLDVERSCKKLGIELIEGPYDMDTWLKAVSGLEQEPEKGARCEVCFDKRFETSAHKALELGETSMTTTLLVSPKKSQDQLIQAGELFEHSHGVKFIAFDYRKKNGTTDQSLVSKQEQLYRQDYCGCLFGLSMQREQQHKLMDEMFSPISQQILPASIEERLHLYQERNQLEEHFIKYKIFKERFYNYRLLRGFVRVAGIVKDSYPLFYSTLSRTTTQGYIEFSIDKAHYLNREEVIFIDIATVNSLAQSNYISTRELAFQPLSISNELHIREKLTSSMYSLSAIIVLDEIPNEKIEIFLETKQYEDTREVLVKL